jgi:hypothetical protein
MFLIRVNGPREGGPLSGTLRTIGVRFWGGILDSGQTVARDRGLKRRLSSDRNPETQEIERRNKRMP